MFCVLGDRCVCNLSAPIIGLDQWMYVQVGLRSVLFSHLRQRYLPTQTLLMVLARLSRELEFAIRYKRKATTQQKIVDRIVFWCARISMDGTTINQLVSQLDEQVRRLSALKDKPAKAKTQ